MASPERRGRLTLTRVRPAATASAGGEFVESVRSRLPKGALVGGAAAESHDLERVLAGRLPLVYSLVVAVGFVLLLLVVRAPIAAAAAVLMNLLATAAAFGVAKLVFQDGHGQGLLGFSSQGFVDAWAPIFFFALIFALAMDYSVFLLSSIRAELERSGSPRAALVEGLARSGRVINAAGGVMVVVFFTFALTGPLAPKEMGAILGVAVLLDTLLVRLLLLPAVLRLLGPHRLVDAAPAGPPPGGVAAPPRVSAGSVLGSVDGGLVRCNAHMGPRGGLFALVGVLVACSLSAGAGVATAAPLENVLVFSETAGFRHDSIPQAGIAAIQELGAANDFAVTATEDTPRSRRRTSPSTTRSSSSPRPATCSTTRSRTRSRATSSPAAATSASTRRPTPSTRGTGTARCWAATSQPPARDTDRVGRHRGRRRALHGDGSGPLDAHGRVVQLPSARQPGRRRQAAPTTARA